VPLALADAFRAGRLVATRPGQQRGRGHSTRD
jgi:hypothetical protein